MKYLGNVNQHLNLEQKELLNSFSDNVCIVHISDIGNLEFIPNFTILLAESLSPSEVIEIKKKYHVKHIVQLNAWNSNVELKIAANMIESTGIDAVNPVDVFLKEKNGFNGWNKELVIKFHHASEKQIVLKKIGEFLQHVPKSRVMQNDALAIADEFFTNAIFHSPASNPEEKRKRFSRDKSVEIQQGQEARLIVAHNNETLFLGAEDPFGDLNLSAVLDRFNKCFQQGIAQTMNMGPGGAGIGLFMLYNLSVSMVFCVKKKRSTLVGCFLPLGKSLRQKETFGKCIHICELEN